MNEYPKSTINVNAHVYYVLCYLWLTNISYDDSHTLDRQTQDTTNPRHKKCLVFACIGSVIVPMQWFIATIIS